MPEAWKPKLKTYEPVVAEAVEPVVNLDDYNGGDPHRIEDEPVGDLIHPGDIAADQPRPTSGPLINSFPESKKRIDAEFKDAGPEAHSDHRRKRAAEKRKSVLDAKNESWRAPVYDTAVMIEGLEKRGWSYEPELAEWDLLTAVDKVLVASETHGLFPETQDAADAMNNLRRARGECR
jgi:hypothetical protein